jgi:hypothetical protein
MGLTISLPWEVEKKVRMHAIAMNLSPESVVEQLITGTYTSRKNRTTITPSATPIKAMYWGLKSEDPSAYQVIEMARGQFAITDPDFVVPDKTRYHLRSGIPYRLVTLITGQKRMPQRLACDVLDISPGASHRLIIEYLNGNPLDCRRLNLQPRLNVRSDEVFQGLMRCEVCGRYLSFDDMMPASDSDDMRTTCRFCAGDTTVGARGLSAQRGRTQGVNE